MLRVMRGGSGDDSYSKLPDEREVWNNWPGAAVAKLEKMRRSTRWFYQHWSWRTVVLNEAGHLVVYRTMSTGRVYALRTARKITVRLQPQHALLHVHDSQNKHVSLRIRGKQAANWIGRLLQFATQPVSHIVEQLPPAIEQQNGDGEQSTLQETRGEMAVQASMEQIAVASPPLIFEQSSTSITQDDMDETQTPTVQKTSCTQSATAAQTTNEDGWSLSSSSTGSSVSSSGSGSWSSTEQPTVIPKRSRSLSASGGGSSVGRQHSCTPQQSLSAEASSVSRAQFVRHLSAVLQRRIDGDSAASAASSCSSRSSSVFSCSEWKTRGTVQMFRAPPPPPSQSQSERHLLSGPSPTLSADFLDQLRAIHRP